MEYTSRYFKNFWKIFFGILGLVGTVFAAFISAGYTPMVDYYCTDSLYAACPVYVALAQIFIVSFVICFASLVVVLAFDSSSQFAVKIKNSKSAKYILNLGKDRLANITIVPAPMKDECFIAIRNDEFLYQVDNVIVNSKFYNHKNIKVNKNLKWLHNEATETTSIQSKKHKSLHFATLSENELVIHFFGGDEVFPFPNEINSYYVIPLEITGSVSLFGYKVNRIKLQKRNAVLIYNNKEIKIEW